MSTFGSKSIQSDGSRRARSAQLEERLVRKRQAEFERLNFWNSSSTYFRTWDFNTNLYSNWMSDNSEKVKKAEELKRRQEHLVNRRKKLKLLLESEEQFFADELTESKKRKPILFEDVNAANIELLLREEETRRKERDLKMYYQWKQNQPLLREFEAKQHSEYVKRYWLEQLIEKRKLKEAEEKKMVEYMEELKKMQEDFDVKEKELKIDKARTETELKNFLEKQIELVKCKEEQEKIFRSEEIEILRLQQDLEDMIEERKRVEQRRERIDLSLFHKRQYQLLLKRRAMEIQENLEFDRMFLEKLATDKKYEMEKASEKCERFKKDLDVAREIYRKQMEIEKLRTEQVHYLFDEEAKRMYEEQQNQWKMESDARNKLLNDVLKTLQLQVEEKLLTSIKNQEESRREREEILKDIERANRELDECQKKEKASLEKFKKDLEQQIFEKKLETYYRRKKQEEDKENELKAKREEEEKLCKELCRMYLSGYQNKPTGRRKSEFQRNIF